MGADQSEKPCATDLSRCCYGDTRDVAYSLVVLPWGATEPHNLHLPYQTDTLIAQRVALEAAAVVWRRDGIRVMVLPPVPFGSQNPGQWNKPFCLHTRYETQRALLGDIVVSLRRQGFSRMVILNGHGGNSFRNMVRDLAFEYPDFLIAVSDSFAVVSPDGYFEERDDHAGEMETSMMMYYYPELVTLADAGRGDAGTFSVKALRDHTCWVPRDWDRVSSDTGIGNPCKSSIEKGRRYAQAVTGRLADFFKDLATTTDLYDSK